MNLHRPRRLLVAVALAGVLAVTAGCTSNESDEDRTPTPTTTRVSTPDAWEQEGPKEPLATAAFSFGVWSVYEEARYTAEEGCGCAVEEGGPELYPAGSEAIFLRVVFTPEGRGPQGEASMAIPDLQLQGAVAGVDGLAEIETVDGPQRAEELDVPWLPEGLFPDGAGTATAGEPLEFAVAYYLPPGAQMVRLTLTGHYDPVEVNWPAKPTELEVPISPSQAG